MNEFSDLLQKGITFIPFGPPLESPPLSPQDIAKWETIVNAPFPKQYLDYLLHCNGGRIRISPTHKYTDYYSFAIEWPHEIQRQELTLNSLFGDFLVLREIRDLPTETPEFTVTFEYTYNTWKEFLPPDTFPIALDQGGNLILIGLTGDRTGKIYYWRFETADAIESPETAAYASPGFIADSFMEFILSLEYMEDE